MRFEKMSRGTDVGDHVKKYVDRFFATCQRSPSINKTEARLVFGIVLTIVFGLIYGLAVRPSLFSFGIAATVMVAFYLLHMLILMTPHPNEGGAVSGSCKIEDKNENKFVREYKKKCEDAIYVFGRNPLDKKAVAFLKGLARKKSKKERRNMYLSLISPLTAFAIGMATMAFGISLVSKIIFPIGFFIGWVVVVYYGDICKDINKLVEVISEYACPKCNMVNSHVMYNEEYSGIQEFDVVVGTKTGERAVGSVYSGGQKVGVVSQSYTTQTHRTGKFSRTSYKYRCTCCGHEYDRYKTMTWDVKTYKE